MKEILENALIFLNNQDYIDIFIYIFIIYLIIYGWRKGSSLIIFYIISFLVSIFLSFKYSFSIGVYISGWLNSNQQISQIFAGLLIFVAAITVSSSSAYMCFNQLLDKRRSINEIDLELQARSESNVKYVDNFSNNISIIKQFND